MSVQSVSSTEKKSGAVVSTGCCPPFDPSTFQDREVVWKNKPFVKERVHCFFHVPLDMNPKMKNVMRKIERAHAKPAQGLMLSEDLSPWRSDLYIDVAGPVPDAVTTTLSGTFYTHVYEGPYRDAPKWFADMTERLRARGQMAKKIYLAYTTCPACAKAYGKNYVVLFAQLPDAG